MAVGVLVGGFGKLEELNTKTSSPAGRQPTRFLKESEEAREDHYVNVRLPDHLNAKVVVTQLAKSMERGSPHHAPVRTSPQLAPMPDVANRVAKGLSIGGLVDNPQ